MYRLMIIVKDYWIGLVLGAVIFGMLWYIPTVGNKASELEAEIASVEEQIGDAKAQLESSSEEFDAEEHKKVIEGRTVSAEKIAEEFIAVDDELTAFYKSNEDMPTDEDEIEAIVNRLEKVQAENTRLTGASDSDHIKTWQLNPEWTLELESVVTYQDTDRVPVVFSMTTKEGKSAGLVHAIYDVERHQLREVVKHYTTDGMRDAVDVGGA